MSHEVALSTRRAFDGDIGTILKIKQSAYLRHNENINFFYEKQDKIRAIDRIYLLLNLKERIGFVEFYTLGKVVLIEDLAISLGFQRKGGGFFLVSFVESKARICGCRETILNTRKSYDASVDFYTAVGFSVTLERGDRLTLAKKL